MTQDHFKFDVRVRDRLRRRGAVSQDELEKHLRALPDVATQAHLVEVPDPTSIDQAAGRSNGSARGDDDA